MTRPQATALDLTPAPGAAPMPRMVLAQAGAEVRAMLRNGEQLLLTMIIPVLLLVGFSALPLVDLGTTRRIDFLAPGVLALAIMSTAFTGQAIATGFERRYGVLKRLGATPLTRRGLLLAKTLAVLAVQAVQTVVIVAVALALGWRPDIAPLTAVPALIALVVLGTAAFSGLGLLMAGTLRAEATLAAANLVYLLLLGCGEVVVPLARFPDAIEPVLGLLPISALSGGLRTVLAEGAWPAASDAVILAVWAAGSLTSAARTFRWD